MCIWESSTNDGQHGDRTAIGHRRRPQGRKATNMTTEAIGHCEQKEETIIL